MQKYVNGELVNATPTEIADFQAKQLEWEAGADDRAEKKVRGDRDNRLAEVDAISSNALRWAALDADTQAAWATYRQALLDVPQQAGFPNTVAWPTKP